MQISVTARHMPLSEGLKEFGCAKIEREMNEFPRVENIHLVLNQEKYRHIAEIVVQAKNHVRVESKTESDDMYASIDKTVEKAAKQLRKLRDKIQDHRSNPDQSRQET